MQQFANHLSSYLKDLLDTGSWRKKLKIALFGELGLEEAIDLSRDRQILESWISSLFCSDGPFKMYTFSEIFHSAQWDTILQCHKSLVQDQSRPEQILQLVFPHVWQIQIWEVLNWELKPEHLWSQYFPWFSSVLPGECRATMPTYFPVLFMSPYIIIPSSHLMLSNICSPYNFVK
jgi:hypothetical protein